MKHEEIRMTLSILEMGKFKAIITLKNKQSSPIIAKVKDFEYKGGKTKVILKRCEETVFPNDSDDQRHEDFMLSLNDIEEVERYN